MGKILFWLAVLALVWIGWRVVTAQRKSHNGGQDGAPSRPAKDAVQMTQCAYCGVHSPASDAVTGSDGRTYCSSAHRDAAGQR